MKYLIQIGIITGICFTGELLSLLLPLPIPGSVYGLILLFLLLCLRIVKPEQIQDVSNFFMSILPILFISPSVKLMTSLEVIGNNLLPILLILFCSTVAVTAVTGLSAQFIFRRKDSNRQNTSKEPTSQ